MNTLFKIAIAAAATAAITGAASADPYHTPFLDERQEKQAERIYDGVASGDLTLGEAAGLMRGQARLRAKEYRFKHNDGVIGPRERVRLHRGYNRESRRIFRRRHN